MLDQQQTPPRYRLLRLLKRGGMAEVHEALLTGDSGFERRVAIKRPLPSTGTLGRETFADEARILAHLDHPGILRVIELGLLDGQPIQAMELIDGADLAELTELAHHERDPLTPTIALYLTAEIAEALHYAHEARDPHGDLLHIVHRDVSPQNILISWTGEIKLADFGIALAAIRRAATRPGVIKGKLAFMSPEQLAGDPLSRRADIFSLGCVLHAMFTQESPFQTADARARAQRGGRVQLSADLPDPIAAIIRRAIAHDPLRRFATAREMANACRVALKREHEHERERATDPREELRTWLDRLKKNRPEKRRSVLSQLFGVEAQPAKAAQSTMLDDGSDPPLDFDDDGPPTERTPWPAPIICPQRCGRFEILERLGKAGLGELYLARPIDPDLPAELRAVVKVLPRELALDPALAASFFAEASALAEAEDESLPRIYAYGAERDQLFAALEHTPGHVLRELLSDVAQHRPGLTRAQIAAIGAGIARGIAAFTGVRRAPRDIRADTVLLTEDGGVKLVDFVYASRAERVHCATATPISAAAHAERLELRALGACLEEMSAAGGAEHAPIDPLIFAKLDASAAADRLAAIAGETPRAILAALICEVYRTRALRVAPTRIERTKRPLTLFRKILNAIFGSTSRSTP